MSSSFRDTTYTHFLPQGVNIELIFALQAVIFKIAIFGHETWPLDKVPEVAYTVIPL